MTINYLSWTHFCIAIDPLVQGRGIDSARLNAVAPYFVLRIICSNTFCQPNNSSFRRLISKSNHSRCTKMVLCKIIVLITEYYAHALFYYCNKW